MDHVLALGMGMGFLACKIDRASENGQLGGWGMGSALQILMIPVESGPEVDNALAAGAGRRPDPVGGDCNKGHCNYFVGCVGGTCPMD